MHPLSHLHHDELRRRLTGPAGLRLRTGPFTFSIRSPLPEVAEGLALHYGGHAVLDEGEETFCDHHIRVERPRGLRRWIRPQVIFCTDVDNPFLPLPGNQGYPMLEWGMNWSISFHAHQYLIIHAAVLERQGRALLMPAPPGSGKSTLCAALAWRGWRLLSDELALIEPETGLLWPLARPVSLKNRSIDLIRAWEPRAVFNPPVHETVKGSVSHMSAPPSAVERVGEPARPGWIVMPRYLEGASPQWQELPRARAYMELQQNTFNHHIHGEAGVSTLARLVGASRCARFTYSRLDDAMPAFAALAEEPC